MFICYKRYSADTLAERLRSALKDYEISAFVDTFDIPKEYELTEKWWQERDSAIINSRTFVMIVTIGFERSPRIVDEIKLAERHDRQFMCFRWANLRPEILIDLGDHKLNLKDIEQTEFGAADELVRRFFDCYGKGHSIGPKKVTVRATKRMPTLASRNLLPLVHYEITQSIQNTEYKRKLPDVGFYIRSWHGYPIRARVKARVILGDKDLGMEKGEYRNGKYMGYYNGRTPWNLNPYAIVFGHFSIPQECVQGVQSEETLTIEVRVSLKDQNGQTFEYLPVAFTYMPKSNSWFFEPRSF